MSESVLRECRDCGLEKLYIADGKGADAWKGRRCPECAKAERKRQYDTSGKHVPGRQRNFRQHREIKGVLSGANFWVTCSACRQMKRYQPRPSGKGGIGWRGLQCADCSNAYARQYRAARQAEGPRSGPCSKCGQEGPLENGRQCKSCFRAHQAAYVQGRRGKGKDGWRVHLPAHSRRCKRCRNRCRVAGWWRGSLCPDCCQRDDRAGAKKYRQNLRAQMISAGEWLCSACKEIQPVEDGAKGWQSQKCPECAREYQRARYHEKLKHNPEYRARKLQRSRSYETRRALAVQDAGNQDATRSSGGQDTGVREGAEIAPQGGKTGKVNGSPPVEDA